MSDETRKALVRAGKQFDRWRGEREKLIVQAHSEGASLREIAIHVGLTHVAVMKILRATSTSPRRTTEPCVVSTTS